MSQYILYGYDYKTREFQGPRPAQLRPGGQPILTSGSATPTASGLHKVGFAQVWRGEHDGSDWPHAHLTLELAAEGADGAWWYIADHRQEMDTEGRLIEGTGTPHWLPAPCDEADDWRSEPRYTKELGPLPEGAVLERPEKPAPTLEEAKTAKLAEINASADALLSVLTSSYPQTELLTFDKQEAEARSHIADTAVPTPLLSALAAGRGIPLDDLAGKVIVKADAFSAASGYVIGQRQALEDKLDAAHTVEDVQAIVVDIRLPGIPEAPEARV